MKVFVQSVNFNADKELVDFVEEKVKQLDKFYDKIINVEVFLKVQKTSEKDNKLVEIKMSVPGDEFMAKKQAKYMEEGVNMALDILKRQLKKKKEKIRA